MIGPALNATSGVMIQGATIGQDGTFMPQTAYSLTASGTSVTCYMSPLSAVLIAVT